MPCSVVCHLVRINPYMYPSALGSNSLKTWLINSKYCFSCKNTKLRTLEYRVIGLYIGWCE